MAGGRTNKVKASPCVVESDRMSLGSHTRTTTAGVLQISAGMNRSQSEPHLQGQPRGGHSARSRNGNYGAQLDRVRKETIRCNPSIAPKYHSQGEITTVKDHVVPDNAPTSPNRNEWYSAATRSHSSPGAPLCQSNYWNFRPGAVGPTSAEIIRKSKDHIGYGAGTIARGDIAKTAVSAGSPSWFCALRMVPGPYDVPRYPSVDIADGKMSQSKRCYVRGENLSVVESTIDTCRSPKDAKKSFQTPRFDDWREYKRNVDGGFQCVHGLLMCDRSPCEDKKITGRSYMIGAGCTVKNPYYPRSDYVSLDPPFHNKTPTQAGMY